MSSRDPVRVKNALHFVDRTKGFLGTAKHFYVKHLFEHHFLVKSTYYEEEQKCAVEMIHFTRDETNDMYIEPFKSSAAAIYGSNMRVQPHDFSFSIVNAGTEAKYTSGDEDSFKLLTTGSWFMVEADGYPNDDDDECDKVWREAYKKLGYTEYSLLDNNCEHFVTEMLTGKPVSLQIKCYNGLRVILYCVQTVISLLFALIHLALLAVFIHLTSLNSVVCRNIPAFSSLGKIVGEVGLPVLYNTISLYCYKAGLIFPDFTYPHTAFSLTVSLICGIANIVSLDLHSFYFWVCDLPASAFEAAYVIGYVILYVCFIIVVAVYAAIFMIYAAAVIVIEHAILMLGICIKYAAASPTVCNLVSAIASGVLTAVSYIGYAIVYALVTAAMAALLIVVAVLSIPYGIIYVGFYFELCFLPEYVSFIMLEVFVLFVYMQIVVNGVEPLADLLHVSPLQIMFIIFVFFVPGTTMTLISLCQN